jgi:hypothetical protein
MTREEIEREIQYMETYIEMHKHPIQRQVERFEKEMWRDRLRCKNLPKIKII